MSEQVLTPTTTNDDGRFVRTALVASSKQTDNESGSIDIVDEQGNRLFDDSEVAILGRLRVDVLNRIFETAQRLSGVSDDDIEELKKPSVWEAGSGSSGTSQS